MNIAKVLFYCCCRTTFIVYLYNAPVIRERRNITNIRTVAIYTIMATVLKSFGNLRLLITVNLQGLAGSTQTLQDKFLLSVPTNSQADLS